MARQALKLDALDPELLHLYSNILPRSADPDEALALRQQLRQVEPFVSVFNAVTARLLAVYGQPEAALAMAEALPADFLQRFSDLARLYARMGRTQDAAAILLAAPAQVYPPAWPPGRPACCAWRRRAPPSRTGRSWRS
ncbi:MAG: hypothetical protein AB7E79_15100 [Rhodospirillaceae bacterium]